MVPPGQADDQQIVDWIAKGDERGIVALLHIYGGRVSGYLRKRFPALDDQERQDVLVDAVMAVGESFDVQRGSLASWFLFLAHRTAIDWFRARRNDLPTQSFRPENDFQDLAGATDQPIDGLAHQEHCQAVRTAMRRLSRLERAVLEADLAMEDVANAEELANQLGTTADSIYAARHRARRKLLQQLGHLLDGAND